MKKTKKKETLHVFMREYSKRAPWCSLCYHMLHIAHDNGNITRVDFIDKHMLNIMMPDLLKTPKPHFKFNNNENKKKQWQTWQMSNRNFKFHWIQPLCTLAYATSLSFLPVKFSLMKIFAKACHPSLYSIRLFAFS